MRGILIAALLVAAAPAHADGPMDARAHYEEGTKLYDLGRYSDAAHEYEKAFQLRPDPALLFNIGQAYRQAGEDTAALRAYRGFLRRFADADNRPQVEGYIRTLQARVDARGGATPAAPAPGPTPVAAPAAATAAGANGVTTSVAAPALAAAPPPGDRPVPVYKRWWLWTAVGVVVVGGAVGLAVALTTPNDAHAPTGTMTLVFP